MKNKQDTEPPFAAAHGSATGEPRVKTLLRSMLAALERDDLDTYWVTFGMLLSLHDEMMKSPNAEISDGTPKI